MLENYRRDIACILKRPPRLGQLLTVPLLTRGARAVALYRMASACHRRGWRRTAWLIRRFNDWANGCTLHEAAEIGGGLVLPHPVGVFVGRDTRIGSEVWIFQGVTLGPRIDGGRGQEPSIGSHVLIYPGAGVYGPVRVGDYVVIGPSAVIYRDVPEGSTVLPPEPRVLQGISALYRKAERSAAAPGQPPEPVRDEPSLSGV
jgi:serine O-acetyltransferase